MTATASRSAVLRPGLVVRGIGLVVAVGLVVDAFVHFQLAPDYQLAAPGGIGQGNLFRIAAVAAVLTALWVLVRPSRLSFAAAFLVAASALAAVLLYRYVDVPALGPIPSMYEPLWFPEKTFSAVAEAVAAGAALVGLSRTRVPAVAR
jgi:hypothetical protein